ADDLKNRYSVGFPDHRPCRVTLEIRTSDVMSVRNSPRRHDVANTLASRDRSAPSRIDLPNCSWPVDRFASRRRARTADGPFAPQPSVHSKNPIMRQTLFLAPLVALAFVSTGHAEEPGGAPSLNVGGLSITPFGQ